MTTWDKDGNVIPEHLNTAGLKRRDPGTFTQEEMDAMARSRAATKDEKPAPRPDWLTDEYIDAIVGPNGELYE